MRGLDDTLSFDLLCSLYSLAVIDFIIVFSATFVLDTQCQRKYTDHPAYCHLSVLISRTLGAISSDLYRPQSQDVIVEFSFFVALSYEYNLQLGCL